MWPELLFVGLLLVWLFVFGTISRRSSRVTSARPVWAGSASTCGEETTETPRPFRMVSRSAVGTKLHSRLRMKCCRLSKHSCVDLWGFNMQTEKPSSALLQMKIQGVSSLAWFVWMRIYWETSCSLEHLESSYWGNGIFMDSLWGRMSVLWHLSTAESNASERKRICGQTRDSRRF